MQLKAIRHYLEQYEQFLRSDRAYDRLHIWESQKIFQDNWDLDEPDLLPMYDKSLQNSRTKRLWKRENYEPKLMLMKFLELEPEFIRSMFKDLFNEEKSVENRVGRFVFYCDQLLNQYKKANPASIENNHYHDDNYQMVSLYLAFRYPENYTLYQAEAFKKLLHMLGNTNIPQANDMERFVKVTKTLYKMMEKEESLMALHQKRLSPQKHYTGNSLLLVHDFYYFLTDPTSKLELYIDKRGR